MSPRTRRLKPIVLNAVAGLLGAASGLAARGLSTARPPKPPRVGSALDHVNDDFHEGYEGAKARAQLDAPVFVVLADTLVLYRGEARTAVTFTPRLFHVIKSVAHAPLALFVALTDARGDTRASLARVRAHIESARASLEDEGDEGDPSVVRNLTEILDASRAFADRVAAMGVTPDALAAFAASTAPALLRSTDDATRIQLDALNRHVAHLLGELTDHERESFHVVVTGDHQARRRSMGMQYFAALVGEGEGTENRVTYGEAVSDEAGALALVGTERINRVIAGAFFGDPSRLQKDVLGDAVEQRLKTLELPNQRART